MEELHWVGIICFCEVGDGLEECLLEIEQG